MCMRKRERMDLDSSSLEISRSKTQEASSIRIVHCLPLCAISSLSRMLGSSAADYYTFPSSSSYAHHRPSRSSSDRDSVSNVPRIDGGSGVPTVILAARNC